MALDSRGSASPGRLRAQTSARPVLGASAGPTQEHLLRGVAWGLVFAAPVWLLLVAVALWWWWGAH